PLENEIEMDHKIEFLKYARTGMTMHLDIWIPRHFLAMEYQGRQHYLPNNFLRHHNVQICKDIEKIKICQSIHIGMIQVPFWLDLTHGSLAATIQRVLL